MCDNQSTFSQQTDQSGNSDSDQTAFVFGCGYLGIRVARRLVSNSWKVTALTRSPSRANWIAGQGVFPVLGDWTDRRCFLKKEVAEALNSGAARVLISVGFDSRSGQSRREVYVDGLRNALDHIRSESELVYVSSTGVFHQSDSQWVDETSPCRPDRDGGKAHLAAESLLWRYRFRKAAGRSVVLRMAGLYGPGRVPRVESIRQGQPIAADPSGYLNLIHIDDAATAVMAAWEHPSPERLYLVADGTPVVRSDYFEEIARIVGGPSVRYSGESGPRSDSSKRIWTRRMRRDLLAAPKFPSYRVGLRSILT